VPPAHAEDDDLPVEMAALEKMINAQHPGPVLKGKFAVNMPRFGRSQQNPFNNVTMPDCARAR
jgi:hypothetical protein